MRISSRDWHWAGGMGVASGIVSVFDMIAKHGNSVGGNYPITGGLRFQGWKNLSNY